MLLLFIKFSSDIDAIRIDDNYSINLSEQFQELNLLHIKH